MLWKCFKDGRCNIIIIKLIKKSTTELIILMNLNNSDEDLAVSM